MGPDSYREAPEGQRVAADRPREAGACPKSCFKNQGNSLADYYIADNVSSLSYYPYGMVMPGREYSSPVYRYGFQGQERDDEVKGKGNSWNYKFRMHDPRVGRFFAVDPLAGKYPHNSVYAFSENRVVDGVELEGLEFANANMGVSPGGTFMYDQDGTAIADVSKSVEITAWSPRGKHEDLKTLSKTDFTMAIDNPIPTSAPIDEDPLTPLPEASNLAIQPDQLRQTDMSPYTHFRGIHNNEEVFGNFIVTAISPAFPNDLHANQWVDLAGNEYSTGGALFKNVTLATGVVELGVALNAAKSTAFYRGMSNESAEIFLRTGKMPAGSETFISPTKAFAQDYGDQLFKIKLNSSAISQLESIGVRNAASTHPLGHLPLVKEGWKRTNAFFKVEGTQINIGLGNGRALKIFNSNIRTFKVIE